MDNHSIFPNSSMSIPNDTTIISSQLQIILYSIVLVWTLLGNILVVIVIFGNEGLKTNFNYLIVNMAISDLAVPLFALPIKIAEQASGTRYLWLVSGTLGNVLCKLCYLLADISPAVSVFTLLAISVNRLIAIVFPLRFQTFSKKKGYLLILATWVMAVAVFSPYFYIFKLVKVNDLNLCGPSWPTFQDKTAFISTIIMVLFFIPMGIIILVYSFLMYKVNKNSKTVNNMLNNQQVQSRRRRNKQIFYISVAIVAAFIILWGPFYLFLSVVGFIWKWQPPPIEPKTTEIIMFVVVLLGYLNPAVNPCIYFLFVKNYRQGLKRIFEKRRVRRCSETNTFFLRTLRGNAETMPGTSSAEPSQCQLVHVKYI
ncbi:octopamine receptor 1-like [Actinia tenebrosa]|uniref:Octopamine receptor 1-like n=1 Tax=Actinia tenebrosa TaxID=6105 RepID=A0A6P8ITH5_ACTTE|nr:octopamine receptor 1-like [Actinia tenebrosa]XP_031570299.1 octopamine receptor 1-like [Actinia tenebrosa]XP_031570300.1 octopamine receptor 1-like [Actinia tenebrosa]XP_031570302.1 octopamine receptor 1-like [Actinia tenebrosa]XP_031570303.1 octopamine receptor 1-like [Actinia tenebrosa]XP_031570304.1 octopamine receptor 1-like [Actinia tenebrosa]XP_031570305.1 octopamine receptor 1-like [Actinia tenebrosa]XP_031570306.1 octopamine receptor 1-like [Actinia tenebrosa]